MLPSPSLRNRLTALGYGCKGGIFSCNIRIWQYRQQRKCFLTRCGDQQTENGQAGSPMLLDISATISCKARSLLLMDMEKNNLPKSEVVYEANISPNIGCIPCTRSIGSKNSLHGAYNAPYVSYDFCIQIAGTLFITRSSIHDHRFALRCELENNKLA